MAGTVISGRSTALKIQPTEEASELIMVDGFISSSVASVVTPNTQTLASYSGLNMDLVDILSKYDWDVEIALKVAFAESGLNTSAINLKDRHKGCNGSYGAFQLSCLHGTPEELLDGRKNVEIAYSLWKRDGWFPWSTCLNGVVKCW